MPIRQEAKQLTPQLCILRPLGMQGPKIGVKISSAEDFRRLDENVGQLKEEERRTFEGIVKAVKKTGLDIVDY